METAAAAEKQKTLKQPRKSRRSIERLEPAQDTPKREITLRSISCAEDLDCSQPPHQQLGYLFYITPAQHNGTPLEFAQTNSSSIVLLQLYITSCTDSKPNTSIIHPAQSQQAFTMSASGMWEKNIRLEDDAVPQMSRSVSSTRHVSCIEGRLLRPHLVDHCQPHSRHPQLLVAPQWPRSPDLCRTRGTLWCLRCSLSFTHHQHLTRPPPSPFEVSAGFLLDLGISLRLSAVKPAPA